jgi:predicted ATPase/DNA-binding CsgD family transcriptional regulator
MTAFRAQPWAESFSTREIEVLRLISKGSSNREIAQKLHLSIETVKWYNKQMYMKLGVKNRIQALNRAVELDLLKLEEGAFTQEKTAMVGNFPAQLTSFIGREKEVGEIKELLNNNRLVVLTGAGGSGKTRLALKVGEEFKDKYKDGVWLVELANIHDTSLVLGTIAKVLNLTERADAPLSEALKRYLSRRRLLLLIDNLEHLLECAPLIGELLAAAPQLSVIGTSRQRLHIYGEQEYPVQPLNLPDQVSKKNIGELNDIESVALFIKRARAVHPTLSLGNESLEDIARICIRLDGLPLAIELCAPMVKMFPLGVIADRIEKSLDAIPSGPRDLPARQQTLRDTIQWSYNLLEENEKRLFERLAVFNGGGTLHAIEKICRKGITGNVGNILSALVNKNLVLAREREDSEIHFVLLETIRQYGSEKLLASGEAESLAECHAEYFMQLAKQGAVELHGPDQINWTNRFISMYDNMRAALKWTVESGRVESALRLVCALYVFWLRHSDFEEGQWWIKRVMTLSNVQQFPEPYIESLNNLSRLNWLQGNTAVAREIAEQVLPLAQSQPNKHITAEAFLNFGLMLVFQKYDFSRGLALIEEAKNLCHEINDEWELSRAYMILAMAHSLQNEYDTAHSLYIKSFNLFKKLGDIGFQCVAMRRIGDLEILRKNITEGVKAYRESLPIAQAVKNDFQIVSNIWGLARAAKINGNQARAVRLYRASKRILDDMGVWWSGDDPELEKALETARAELSEAEFQSALEEGQHMTMNEAIEFALDAGVASEA